MSSEEILQKQREVQEMTSPELLEFLRNRRFKNSSQAPPAGVKHFSDEAMEETTTENIHAATDAEGSEDPEFTADDLPLPPSEVNKWFSSEKVIFCSEFYKSYFFY